MLALTHARTGMVFYVDPLKVSAIYPYQYGDEQPITGIYVEGNEFACKESADSILDYVNRARTLSA